VYRAQEQAALPLALHELDGWGAHLHREPRQDRALRRRARQADVAQGRQARRQADPCAQEPQVQVLLGQDRCAHHHHHQALGARHALFYWTALSCTIIQLYSRPRPHPQPV